MLIILLSLIAPGSALESKSAEGWQKTVNSIHLACDNGLISVTHAKYYAPRNFFCLPMENALSVTQTYCNNKEDCYLSTQPNEVYGNPCYLWQKKLEVSYNCIYWKFAKWTRIHLWCSDCKSRLRTQNNWIVKKKKRSMISKLYSLYQWWLGEPLYTVDFLNYKKEYIYCMFFF